MKLFKTKIKDTKYSEISTYAPLNDQRALYVDIETTGFSRKHDMIYLIGLLYYEKGELVILQYLCEKVSDEYELLYKFNQLVLNFEELIHFNGDSFDLPFIKERMKLYRIRENLSELKSLDFLKLIRPFKKVLGTDNLKLKTMEKLAGYNRVDPFSGGELIQLYDAYKDGDKKLETTFILHNEEDMVGLYYLNLFRPLISLTHLAITNKDFNLIIDRDHMICQVLISLALPLNYYDIDLKREEYSILLKNNNLRITLPLYNGEYKTYFDDFENYYYLTHEDYAIHESVASFVQTKYKKKATKHTAYTKREDIYIKCPVKKLQILSSTVKKDNVYIFNETINDSFVLLRSQDLQMLLPEILSEIIKNLMF